MDSSIHTYINTYIQGCKRTRSQVDEKQVHETVGGNSLALVLSFSLHPYRISLLPLTCLFFPSLPFPSTPSALSSRVPSSRAQLESPILSSTRLSKVTPTEPTQQCPNRHRSLKLQLKVLDKFY